MAEAMIEFQSVTKQYQSGQPAVDQLSMSIDRGSITVFVGPSGCGKTTSLRMINRMVEPTSGTITVGGRDVTSVPAAELRRSMGYVMQSSGLMPHRSVVDNIATVPRLNGVSKAERPQTRGRTARRRGAGPVAGQAVPVAALGRPAAARRRGPGARRRSAGPADGRALQCRGSRGPRRTAAGAPAAAARPGQDHRFCHPRHRRSHRAGGQGGRVFAVGGKLAQYATPEEILRAPANEFVASFVGRDRGFRHLAFTTADGVAVHPVETVTRVSGPHSGPTRTPGAWWWMNIQRPLGWEGPGLDGPSSSPAAPCSGRETPCGGPWTPRCPRRRDSASRSTATARLPASSRGRRCSGRHRVRAPDHRQGAL
jgi:osmoprotectant transport system ATP-binding protein